jgi:hypothetical protein
MRNMALFDSAGLLLVEANGRIMRKWYETLFGSVLYRLGGEAKRYETKRAKGRRGELKSILYVRGAGNYGARSLLIRYLCTDIYRDMEMVSKPNKVW